MIELTCGCQRTERNAPINDGVTYPCPSNQGHGYRLGWVRWKRGNVSRANRRLNPRIDGR